MSTKQLHLFPELLPVISASRRTDMVAGNPDLLAEILTVKHPPERVHSLVIWTKNPYNLLYHTRLRGQVGKYDLVYLHYSITGLGNTILEPHVPTPQAALSFLPELLKLLKNPLQIRIRFDPVVHFRLADGTNLCNLKYFGTLAPYIAQYKIRDVSTSWVQIYGKVSRRLQGMKIVAQEMAFEQWQEEADWLQTIAKQNNLQMHGCCVPGWPVSHCIDGDLLNSPHPKGFKASTKRATGQRKSCGCTASLDIGWYYACPHGCVYCYGNPQNYSMDL